MNSTTLINIFVLLLFKGIYPEEYLDEWGKFGETFLSNIENFYSNVNFENIYLSDYKHLKKFGMLSE